MAYRIAGIDVHKKMLAVVVADVEGESEYQFERRQLGTTPDHLRLLSEWFVEQSPQRNMGNRFGEHWNGTGSRPARSGKVRARCPERCIWHRRSRIAGRRGGRRISPMRNDG
jgi:hypothetical protein